MFFLSKNIQYKKALRLNGWRKIAIGTWRDCGDPSVYGVLELECTNALNYIDTIRKNTGRKITITHFVGKAVAESIKRHPNINCVLRFGRLYPRQTVDIFFQVASDKQGDDLAGTVLRDMDKKTVIQIAMELEEKSKAIRDKRDRSYAQMKGLASILPGFLSKYLLNFGSFIMYTLNLWSPILGVPKDSFGSTMITSVGSLGLDEGLVPLVPYSRIPLLIAIGTIREQPIVKNHQIVVGKTIKLCATIDHRLIDGVHAIT